VFAGDDPPQFPCRLRDCPAGACRDRARSFHARRGGHLSPRSVAQPAPVSRCGSMPPC
jgi:hypothetical protein